MLYERYEIVLEESSSVQLIVTVCVLNNFLEVESEIVTIYVG